MDDLLRLIESWRAARRAATCEDYKAHWAVYARNAQAYALVIRKRLGR